MLSESLWKQTNEKTDKTSGKVTLLEEKLNRALSTINHQQKTIDELVESSRTLTRETKAFRDKFSQMKKDVIDVTKINDDLKNINMTVDISLKDAEEQFQKEENERQVQQERLSKLEIEMKTLKGEHTILKNNKMKASSSENQNKLGHVTKITNGPTADIKTVADYKTIIRQHEFENSSLEKTIEMFKDDKHSLETTIERYKEDNQNLEENNHSLGATIEKLQRRLEELELEENHRRGDAQAAVAPYLEILTSNLNTAISQLKPKESPKETGAEKENTINNNETKHQKKSKERPSGKEKGNKKEEEGLLNDTPGQVGAQKVLKTAKEARKESEANNQEDKVNTHNGKIKCMLIGDSFLSDFNRDKFSKWYDVCHEQFTSLEEAQKPRSALMSKLKKVEPALSVIHLGFGDIWKGSTVEDIVESYKKLIWNLLNNTSSTICVSMLIPTPEMNRFREKIELINRALSEFLTSIRENRDDLRRRIYTINNRVLGQYLTTGRNSKGQAIPQLSDRGEMTKWLILRNGMNRATGKRNVPQKAQQISDNTRKRTESSSTRRGHE